MCDIYLEPCKACGNKIEMHLGDYITDRVEILAFCPKCTKKLLAKTLFLYNLDSLPFPSILWKSKSEKYLIVYLTSNAWIRRKHNSPNIANIEIEKILTPKMMRVYSYDF